MCATDDATPAGGVQVPRSSAPSRGSHQSCRTSRRTPRQRGSGRALRPPIGQQAPARPRADSGAQRAPCAEQQRASQPPQKQQQEQVPGGRGEPAAGQERQEPPPQQQGSDGREELAAGLGALLRRRAAAAALLGPAAEPRRTAFHAGAAPKVSIQFYVNRIREFIPCSAACFVLALAYIERACRLHPDIDVNDLTLHRLSLTSILVAMKFIDDEEDVHYNNAFFAKAGGLKPSELEQLELQLLSTLGWRLQVAPEEYSCCEAMLRDSLEAISS